MKLLILSDLHLESSFFEPQEDAVKDADVVILAGDIHPGVQGIVWSRQVFKDKPVIYIAGNHEYFEGEFDASLKRMRRTAKDLGINFLENDAITLGGIRFLGCTLWTDFEFYGADKATEMMNRAEVRWPDFIGSIQSKESPTGKLKPSTTVRRHWESRLWLQEQLPLGKQSETIVITHHYPNKKSTPSRYIDDEMNVVFGSQIPDELTKQASLWIHGHAHQSVNYCIGDGKQQVRVIANPRGYVSFKNDPENWKFNSGFLVEQKPDGRWDQI